MTTAILIYLGYSYTIGLMFLFIPKQKSSDLN